MIECRSVKRPIRIAALLLALASTACVNAAGLDTQALADPMPRLLAATPAPSEPSSSTSSIEPAPTPARRRPKRDRGPNDPLFVAAHLSAGVVGTMLVQTATYALVANVGHTGKGLGPVAGALLIGAFMPPILEYTIQWAAGRSVAPGRDRFWPGFLVRQVLHLGIFVGAVAGGANFGDPRQSTAIAFSEALLNSGLATLTAELTRRPPPLVPAPSAGKLAPLQIVVPILELKF
jgi:hypothetical protein